MKFVLKDSMVQRTGARTVEGGEVARGHRIVDLHARACRQLAALRHPADLMDENSSAVPGIRRVTAALRQSALARRRISNRATTSRWRPFSRCRWFESGPGSQIKSII
jgi:hypothetical protein